ncbi:MAG: colanic acid exporter [Candidatus Abyssobacteria bacterium SURF_5]|uniref:Colanic acid exporter n=1 Tax=Abyssobacteria bacterium (strain SURF_5) TaxID=2093360 RepID=A0A3A4N0D2_ABYX5|nr:MAG: colanic acid exporter [Candidatus Abyssubacteria bacterium SURF_5]
MAQLREDFPARMRESDGLRQKTITGVIWSALMQFGQLTAWFLVTVLLARLLTPKDFGLIGMVTVFTGFAVLINEFGFGSALIQRQDIEERHLNSVFWLNVVTGFAFTVLFIAASPLIARLYNEPALIPLTSVVALSFAISSLKVVQHALLNKSMDFRRLAIINVAAVFVAGLIAVGMALTGFGVWSLVANLLIMASIQVLLMWRLSRWRPKFEWDTQAIRELFGFSANLVGFRVLNYWTSNADNLLIGKFISAAALGIYGRAYEFRILPLVLGSWVLDKVMFPALSAIQHDKRRVKQFFLRGNRTIALLTFPMMMGLLVIARPFTLAVFGQKWEAAIIIIQIFCVEAMGRSILTTSGWIYLSQGRTDIQLRWEILVGIVRFLSIIVGLRWGAAGVAAAWTFSLYFILWYPSWTIVGRLIGMRATEVLSNVASIFLCSAIMAGAVFLAGLALPESNYWLRVAVQVPLGAAVYMLVIHFLKVRAYLEVRELVAEQWRLRYGKTADLAVHS